MRLHGFGRSTIGSGRNENQCSDSFSIRVGSFFPVRHGKTGFFGKLNLKFHDLFLVEFFQGFARVQ